MHLQGNCEYIEDNVNMQYKKAVAKRNLIIKSLLISMLNVATADKTICCFTFISRTHFYHQLMKIEFKNH